MLLPLALQAHLPFCYQALQFVPRLGSIQAVPQPTHSSTHLSSGQRAFSTSTPAQQSPWLPATVTRLIKKHQRGKGNYPSSPLEPGQISPIRSVPSHIPRPHYATARATSAGGSKGPGLSKQQELMSTESSRAAMRAVGQLAAQALHLAGSMAVPGTATEDIDAAVHGFLISKGAYPSPLQYHGFPKSVCTSVNEVVCHGVPDSRPLQDGDIVNVDVTAYLNGYHGDTNATFCVGRSTTCPAQNVRERKYLALQCNAHEQWADQDLLLEHPRRG